MTLPTDNSRFETTTTAAPLLADLTNLGEITRLHSARTDRLAFVDLRDPAAPAGYSYPDLERLVSAAATELRNRSFEPGTRIGIMSANRIEYVVAYLGIMRAGLVAVPINVKSGAEILEHILDDASVAMTFVDRAGQEALAGRSAVIEFDDPLSPYLPRLLDISTAVPVAQKIDADVAEILYTSGSSGVPKGVPLTHAGQLWALRSLSSEMAARIETQIIAQPLFHMNGLITLCRGIALGFTTVLCPRFDAAAYVAAIEHYSVTTVAAVPTMWIRAMREVGDDRSRLSSVRSLSLGSAPVTLEQVKRISEGIPDAQVIVSYGTTEAGPAIFGAHPQQIERPPLSLGHPLEGSEVKLSGGADPDHGVLMMRNPAVTNGYHQRDDLSAAVLDDGWYSSGDLMRRDENGFYYFVGRADDMFVCGGENIYPGELESILEKHPSISQAAVVSLPDDERGQIPVAFVVPVGDADLRSDDIKAYVIERAPAYLHPRRVATSTELPLAGTNKIDRRRLHELATQLEMTNGWLP